MCRTRSGNIEEVFGKKRVGGLEFSKIDPFENRPAGLFGWYFGPDKDILMPMNAHDLLCPMATTN